MIGALDVGHVSKFVLTRAVDALRGYRRAQSYLALRLSGLPTLEAVLVDSADPAVIAEVRDAIERKGWTHAMLRCDAGDGTMIKRPGGFLVQTSELEKEIALAVKCGVALVLEPASRFCDLFSGNVLFDTADRLMYWEIVGPGFDLSDISRGKVVPHERFETRFGDDVEDWTTLGPLDVPRHDVATDDEFSRSWRIRIERVADMAGPEWRQNRDPLDRATDFLASTRQTLLLRRGARLTPFGYENLCRVYSMIAGLPRQLLVFGLNAGMFVVSFGILEHRGLVFWDVFYP